MLCTADHITMALHIADAMCFLEAKHVVRQSPPKEIEKENKIEEENMQQETRLCFWAESTFALHVSCTGLLSKFFEKGEGEEMCVCCVGGVKK